MFLLFCVIHVNYFFMLLVITIEHFISFVYPEVGDRNLQEAFP